MVNVKESRVKIVAKKGFDQWYWRFPFLEQCAIMSLLSAEFATIILWQKSLIEFAISFQVPNKMIMAEGGDKLIEFAINTS